MDSTVYLFKNIYLAKIVEKDDKNDKPSISK